MREAKNGPDILPAPWRGRGAVSTGAVTFEKVFGNKKITVNKKTGAVTVKAGLKEGEAYKVKVKVTAAGGKYYKKATRTVVLTVKVSK